MKQVFKEYISAGAYIYNFTIGRSHPVLSQGSALVLSYAIFEICQMQQSISILDQLSVIDDIPIVSCLFAVASC